MFSFSLLPESMWFLACPLRSTVQYE